MKKLKDVIKHDDYVTIDNENGTCDVLIPSLTEKSLLYFGTFSKAYIKRLKRELFKRNNTH